MEYVEPLLEFAVEGCSASETSEMWSGSVGVVWEDRYADGRLLRRIGGDGVSVNMMLGPGPSSAATRVMGTGFDVNFGVEAWREREGRMDCTEAGRSLLGGSFLEDALLGWPSKSDFVTSREVESFDTDAAFLVPCWLCKEAIDDVRSAVEEVFGACVVPTLGEKGLLDVGSGTLTSCSPVDFLEGGGPLMESP